jgi:NAD+ synthase
LEAPHSAEKSPLLLNTEQVLSVLNIFVREEVRKTGFENAVIGLSGGIDSALSTYLAVRALGPEHVHVVLMPYKTSSPESVTDAMLVVNQLGISHEICEITPSADAYFTANPDIDRVRKGNVMARLRMITLYDRSQSRKALVIGTSNKTESLLGYTTLFGDNASAINPIGDLYKTQVWQLSEALGIPKSIVNKAPSADLWAGQTDEQELGLSYREVDRLLYYMVDLRESKGLLIERGFEEAFVERIGKIIARVQFKRRPPIIAKLSSRTINTDFRYPRDWGM